MTANDASPLSRVIDVLNKNTATLDSLFTDKVFNRLIFFIRHFVSAIVFVQLYITTLMAIPITVNWYSFNPAMNNDSSMTCLRFHKGCGSWGSGGLRGEAHRGY